MDRMEERERGGGSVCQFASNYRARIAPLASHVNWLASLISISFGNLSRVKLRRATIDDNAVYLRYTFPPPPPPRHEFNSRREIDGYESVRSCGKIVLFCFHILFRLDYPFFPFFLLFNGKSIYPFTYPFIYHVRSPPPKKIIDDIHPFRELISFQSLPPPAPSSSLVGVFLFRGAAVSPTSILKIARIIRRIPRSNVIIVINPVVLSNE